MIDIRIMAHPSRHNNVMKILTKLSLSDDIVVWDDRKYGGDAMYTSRKAWNLPIPNGCTHRLVLQDDIEICDNFLNIIEQVAKNHTSQVISFFHCEKYNNNVRYAEVRHLWGCALMIPTHLISPCWKYIEHIPEEPWCGKHAEDVMRHDNNCIMFWATNNGIPLINTVPSLVQHIGDDSLVGIREKRVSQDFVKSPPVVGW